MLIECAREGCEIRFERKRHNQIYHDKQCTNLATSAKIMKRYYKNRDRKLGIARGCENCGTKLSRYNDSDVCSVCEQTKQADLTNSVKDMILSISWQV